MIFCRLERKVVHKCRTFSSVKSSSYRYCITKCITDINCTPLYCNHLLCTFNTNRNTVQRILRSHWLTLRSITSSKHLDLDRFAKIRTNIIYYSRENKKSNINRYFAFFFPRTFNTMCFLSSVWTVRHWKRSVIDISL